MKKIDIIKQEITSIISIPNGKAYDRNINSHVETYTKIEIVDPIKLAQFLEKHTKIEDLID